jgi:hypothetical protein
VNRLAAVAAVGLVVALTGGTLGVRSAHAQPGEETRVVEGRVTNGTASAGSIAGLEVVFHQESDTGHKHLETATDDEGRFRFEAIIFEPGWRYGVSLIHQGALYGSDLDLSAASPPSVLLTIYEATDADSTISVSAASVLFGGVDGTSQTVWTLEIAKVENNTDMTYVPGPEPMKLLRFGLPPGAQDLQVETSLAGSEMITVDRGFALTASVPPGEYEVMYSYRFVYSGTETGFTKSFPYGAGDLRVLAPPEVGLLSSSQLGDTESVGIGDRSYQLVRASDLARGSRISVELSGLPKSFVGARLGRRLGNVPVEYAAPAGLALLMVSLLGLALWKRRVYRGAGAPTGPATQSQDAEHNRLIGEIAQVEDTFEKGALSEAEYRRRRAALSARLADLSRRGLAQSD